MNMFLVNNSSCDHYKRKDMHTLLDTVYSQSDYQQNMFPKKDSNFKNSLVIHEGNTKQISTMTVTLYLIKLIDVRKNTNVGFYINE